MRRIPPNPGGELNVWREFSESQLQNGHCSPDYEQILVGDAYPTGLLRLNFTCFSQFCVLQYYNHQGGFKNEKNIFHFNFHRIGDGDCFVPRNLARC
jgi:hypothetical protein